MESEITTETLSSGREKIGRRYPIGAELVVENQTNFRVWAPKAEQLDVVIESSTAENARRAFHPLTREANGYFSGLIEAGAGMRYRFRLNGGGDFHPDPASRYQPEGPHRSSEIVDFSRFNWTDHDWPGIKHDGQILYEFHIGTFTREGTWRAAAEKLPLLKADGITVVEMMPIAEFSGRFGWGYDGVDFFAPCHIYGEPDDLRFFIDRAHSLGLGVILDVVYNHFGPDGNYLAAYSDDYTKPDCPTEWGDCINFDGKNSGPVREFFITNAEYWIEEFHFDGFRFDATQCIFDDSEDYIVGAIGDAARAAAGERSILLIAENEPQEAKLVRPRKSGGDGLDALWNDDWHHSAVVALTGNNEAYYTDYRGTPQEFISAAKYGYLFQGQPYQWQKKPRGQPALDLPPQAFVAFIENHDQVANSNFGERVRQQASPGRYRAMTALLLLGPWTPMLFQGQEFGATTPFVYFSEVGDESLQEKVRKGRFEFMAQFPSAASPETQSRLAVPHRPESFEQCKLDWGEHERNAQIHALHVDLIALRTSDSRLRQQIRGRLDGAVLGPDSFVLRFFGDNNDDRLLVMNLGRREEFSPAPEPLLAPPEGYQWRTVWTSEAPRYGGHGMGEIDLDNAWILPGETAWLLAPSPRIKPRPSTPAR